MTPLHDKLISQINRFGPMTIAEFMTFVLLEPEHGYYTSQKPIGKHGDFITAPEISQMFGEMIGLWLAQTWMDQGAPTPFNLVEFGPGRGTLMADILRATKAVPNFHAAMKISLVEISPTLKTQQRNTLKDYTIEWIENLNALPNTPTYIVANEFFDCLPIRQFHRSRGGWKEQMVALDGTTIGFGLGPEKPLDVKTKGDFVEFSNAATAQMGQIDEHIATHGGATLIIDYGDLGTTVDTFQALHLHQKIDPLTHIGQADLTAHVDFWALSDAAVQCSTTKITAQGAFLERLGITNRAQTLAKGLSGSALETHIQAHNRLTHPDQMGTLFKVLGVHPKNTPPLIGFDQ